MLVENQEAVVKALAAKDPQELFALQASQTRSAMDKAQSYWRHVYEIVSAAQGEFAEVTEAHFKQSQLDAQAFVDGLAKNAPAGSETVVSAWKFVLGVVAESTNSAYDAAKKAAKQVIDVAKRNVTAASSASTEATRQVRVAALIIIVARGRCETSFDDIKWSSFVKEVVFRVKGRREVCIE